MGKFDGLSTFDQAVIDALLNQDTGDEYALNLDYEIDKLTSGNDYGLRLNKTDTNSPGTSYLAWFGVGGAEKVRIDDSGRITTQNITTGNATITSSLFLSAGGTIATTGDGDIALAPDGTGVITASALITDDSTGPLNLGTAATTGHSLTTGDVLIGGKLEVDGTIYFDGLPLIYNNASFRSGSAAVFGDSSEYTLAYQTAGNTALVLGTSDSNQFIIGHKDYRTDNWDHADQLNPTVYIHSSEDPDTDNTQWGSLAHDQTDFLLSAGSGTVKTDVGRSLAYTDVAAATYSTDNEDHILSVSYTATGAVTITLQSADVAAGRVLIIKDAGGNATTNNITVNTQASETIDGASSASIAADDGVLRLYSDGTNWFVW